MATRIGGSRRKSRSKMRKPKSERGHISLRKYFQRFENGDKVYLNPEPAIQTGMFHARFQGQAGTIEGTKGRCYMVTIKDGGKGKTLIIHPVHLTRR
ncbi:MAG: 50S ribosomal protein L21e [Nanoarchaeota archaeon]